MEKKQYEHPLLELHFFDVDDVVRTSSGNLDVDGNDNVGGFDNGVWG